MFINERDNQIIEYLRIHRKATIAELAAAMYASESTIRRDLTQMQEAGLVARYHGGAILLEGINEISIFARAESDSDSKSVCADIAMRHLPAMFDDCNTVFIDNSSTCLALVKRLDFTNKTVITNGLQIAVQLLQKPNVNLILPGGEVNVNTSAMNGALTLRTLEMFSIDLMLSSCASIDAEGVYEFSLETAQLKNLVLSRSKRKMLITTAHKFSVGAPYRSSALDAFDCIITDADRQTLELLTDGGTLAPNTVKNIFNS